MRGSKREIRPGAWELRVRCGKDPDTGKYRQISRYFKGGKRDADTALRKLITQVEEGEVAPPSGLTFGMLLDRWLLQVGNRLAATTLRTYDGYIDRQIRPRLGNVSISNLTTATLNDFYRDLGDTLAPASIRQIHAICRRALRFGVSEQFGGLVLNPATGATLPYQTASEIHPPDVALVAKLLAAADEMDPGFGMLCRVAASSGARRGELCALRWRDVNLTSGVLQIRRAQAVIAPGTVVEKQTKTHQWRRPKLDANTVTLLCQWRQMVDARAAGIGTQLVPDAYLFSSTPDGSRPLHPDALTSSWRRVVRIVGVECRFHDLRHFNATQLLAAGVPVRTVSGRLGHRRASTTQDIYAHWVPESDDEAADVIGGILGGNENEPKQIVPGHRRDPLPGRGPLWDR